jgi:TusA-related sulfurtransferase
MIPIAASLIATLVACGTSGQDRGRYEASSRRAPAYDQTGGATSRGDNTITERTHGGIAGDRTITGKVMDVAADQIKVDTGEVQPRFLPLGMAKEKGYSIKKGDTLEILLNEQNLVVDFHRAGKEGTHKVVRGELATPLTIGQERAVIRTQQGTEQGYEIRPLARSKVAAIPVGVQAVFLIDETNKIADATFGSRQALEEAQAEWQKKSPIKGAHQRIIGTVTKPLAADRITIRTEQGRERPFDVRAIARDKLTGVDEGQRVILMIDQEDQVVDVAIPRG